MEISNPIAAQYVVNQGIAAQLNDHGKQLPIVSEQYTAQQRKTNQKNATDNEESSGYKKSATSDLQLAYGLDPSLVSGHRSSLESNTATNSDNVSTNYIVPDSPVLQTKSSGLVSSINSSGTNYYQAQQNAAQQYEETGRLNANHSFSNVDYFT